MGVFSPRADQDGSKIRSVYYVEEDLERIVWYCELDVVTTARIFLRMGGEPELPDSRVVHSGDQSAYG